MAKYTPGRTLNIPFTIISGITDHGSIGENGQLGYDGDIVTNSLRFKYVISAHANSTVKINTYRSLCIRGFLNGTGSRCCGLDFILNGKILGSAISPYETTSSATISPGTHILQVTHHGSYIHAHSIWGFDEIEDVPPPQEYPIAIAAICTNPNLDLFPWIDHHLSIGVDHIFILTTDDSDRQSGHLIHEKYEKDVSIEVLPRYVVGNLRAEAYRYWMEQSGPECNWIAFIDPNEYINPKIAKNLQKILTAYRDYGGLKLQMEKMMPTETTEEIDYQLIPLWESIGESNKCIVQFQFLQGVESSGGLLMMSGKPIVGERFSEEITSMNICLASQRPFCKEIDEASHDRVGTDGNSEISLHSKILRSKIKEISALSRSNYNPENSVNSDEQIEIVGFIHIAAVNHWKAIVTSQLNKARASGLYLITRSIKVGIVGAGPDTEQQVRMLSNKIEIVHRSENLAEYEFPTLAALHEHCKKEPTTFVWYIHTKGTVHIGAHQISWRSLMEAFVLVHYELALRKLTSGYSLAASHGEADERWYVPGNFWWARGDFIQTLPDFKPGDKLDRWQAEAWVCKRGSEYMYWQESGDTIFPEFRIVKFKVGAGMLTTNGYNSWNRTKVLLSDSVVRDYVISTHAPSVVDLECFSEMEISGFISGSSEKGNWVVEFLVNGESCGICNTLYDECAKSLLMPGRHQIEVKILEGEQWGAHTCWYVKIH